MQKRTRYSLLLALALPAALVTAIVLRKAAPPEAARLLPESDAIVYINLKPIRSLTHFDRTPITRSAEFQHFIDATGIEPERDLDAVAFALHRMDDPNGPNGPVAYSEVFEGRFDGTRLNHYLASIASAREYYAGHTIYTIPVAAVAVASNAAGTADALPTEAAGAISAAGVAPASGVSPAPGASQAWGASQASTRGAPGPVSPATGRRRPAAPAGEVAVRSLRITQLGYDTVAASNMPTAEQIHSILDRFRAGASPFSGSSLLEARYRDVPLLSSAWAIGHIGLPFSTRGSRSDPTHSEPGAADSDAQGRITAFGLELPLPENTTFVASLRYTGSLRLRVDEILPSADAAARSTHSLSALLDLFRSFALQQLAFQHSTGDPTTSPDQAPMREMLNSLRIQQQNDRAILTATVPLPLLKQFTASTQ